MITTGNLQCNLERRSQYFHSLASSWASEFARVLGLSGIIETLGNVDPEQREQRPYSPWQSWHRQYNLCTNGIGTAWVDADSPVDLISTVILARFEQMPGRSKKSKRKALEERHSNVSQGLEVEPTPSISSQTANLLELAKADPIPWDHTLEKVQLASATRSGAGSSINGSDGKSRKFGQRRLTRQGCGKRT